MQNVAAGNGKANLLFNLLSLPGLLVNFPQGSVGVFNLYYITIYV